MEFSSSFVDEIDYFVMEMVQNENFIFFYEFFCYLWSKPKNLNFKCNT